MVKKKRLRPFKHIKKNPLNPEQEDNVNVHGKLYVMGVVMEKLKRY